MSVERVINWFNFGGRFSSSVPMMDAAARGGEECGYGAWYVVG